MGRYLLVFIFSFFFLLLSGAGFIWIVDPYAVNYSTSQIHLQRKTAASDKGRNIKSYQIEHRKPETLIIGNSRVELGLPSEHPLFYGSVFNMGLPGASVLMQYDYSWHAIKVSKSIKKIILAVDFTDFLSTRASAGSWEADWQFRLQYRLADEAKTLPTNLNRYKEQVSFIFSQNALIDSALTVFQQQHDVNALNHDGFNDARLYLKLVRSEGFNALYIQKQQQLKARLSSSGLIIDPNSLAFDALTKFLDLAKSENIEIVMFVNPYQKPYLDLIKELSLEDELLTWKSLIITTASQYQVDFYDFAISSLPVNETPPLESRIPSDNKYFWEPAHYKQTFGNLILDAISNKTCDVTIDKNVVELCQLYSAF